MRVRPNRRRVLTFLCAAAALTGCDGDRVASDVEVPFVVFRDPELVIASLETAVQPPVTVGSTMSPQTAVSDAPDVVSIAVDGSLVAHQRGTATIRSIARAEMKLRVQVLAGSAARLDPPDLELEVGDEVGVRFLADDQPVASHAVRWLTSDANVALARDGRVVARRAGVATLTAEFGAVSASARLVVRPSPAPGLVVRPERLHARVASVVQFEAFASGQAADVVWEATPKDLMRIESPTEGIALKRGTGELCARAEEQRRCIRLTVE